LVSAKKSGKSLQQQQHRITTRGLVQNFQRKRTWCWWWWWWWWWRCYKSHNSKEPAQQQLQKQMCFFPFALRVHQQLR
jgi:hypothetical protein